MKLFINGQGREICGIRTLEDLLARLGYEGSHFAVAVNRACVHRHEFGETVLAEGDAIEILSPMQGG